MKTKEEILKKYPRIQEGNGWYEESVWSAMDEYATEVTKAKDTQIEKLKELVKLLQIYIQLSKQGEIRTKEELAIWMELPDQIAQLEKEIDGTE